MGQDGPTENVIPRVQALRNTQFLKGGSRLVVSLVGVWAPGLWANPIMYTVLEDQIHGANMIAALLVDMLLESVQRQNCLPRRMFIHADNTAKETKNTIVLYAAIWMLVQMQRTRLQSIEFGYLLVGHTHDLIDAMFAWVGKALVGLDVISLPEMFQALQTRMKKPPLWKHLRDFYDFKGCQPRTISAGKIKNIAGPHHVRIFWGRDASICIQSKRWLTSEQWSPPVVVVPADQVKGIRSIMPEPIQPAWDETFAHSSLNWLSKLRELLQSMQRDTSGVTHCEQLVRHELHDFLPSGISLATKISRMRSTSDTSRCGNVIRCNGSHNTGRRWCHHFCVPICSG